MSAATKLFNNRQEVIEAFTTGIFPYIDGFQIEEESEEESVKKSTKDDLKKFSRQVNKKETNIKSEFFKKCFNFQKPSDMLKAGYTTNDKINNALVNVIKSGLADLKMKLKKWVKMKKKLKNQMRQQIMLKKFLSLTNKSKKDED